MIKLPEHLLDVPFTVEATLPGPTLQVRELLELAPGNTVATPHPSGGALDVFAGGAMLGIGELSGVNGRAVIRMVKFRGKS
jgi:flagellar motor switch/type III secretory pathway protein FliN